METFVQATYMSWRYLSISAISQLLLNFSNQFLGALIILDHILWTKLIQTHIFLGPKNSFCTQNFSDSKILDPKFFWIQNCFGLKLKCICTKEMNHGKLVILQACFIYQLRYNHQELQIINIQCTYLGMFSVPKGKISSPQVFRFDKRLLLCMQLLKISLLRFNVAPSALYKICHFSFRQSLQLFVAGL